MNMSIIEELRKVEKSPNEFVAKVFELMGEKELAERARKVKVLTIDVPAIARVVAQFLEAEIDDAVAFRAVSHHDGFRNVELMHLAEWLSNHIDWYDKDDVELYNYVKKKEFEDYEITAVALASIQGYNYAVCIDDNSDDPYFLWIVVSDHKRVFDLAKKVESVLGETDEYIETIEDLERLNL